MARFYRCIICDLGLCCNSVMSSSPSPSTSTSGRCHEEEVRKVCKLQPKKVENLSTIEYPVDLLFVANVVEFNQGNIITTCLQS